MKVSSSAQPADPPDLASGGAGHRIEPIDGKAGDRRDHTGSGGVLPPSFLALLQVALAPLAVIARSTPVAASSPADAAAEALLPGRPGPAAPVSLSQAAAGGTLLAPGGQRPDAPGADDPARESVGADARVPADRSPVLPGSRPGPVPIAPGAIEMRLARLEGADEPSPSLGPAAGEALQPSTAGGPEISTPMPLAPAALAWPGAGAGIDPGQLAGGTSSGPASSSHRAFASVDGTRAPALTAIDGMSTVSGADATSVGLGPMVGAIVDGRPELDGSATPDRDPGNHRSADHREASALAIPGVSATAEPVSRLAAEATQEVARNVPARVIQLVQSLPPAGTSVVMQLDPPLLGSVLLRVVANQSGRVQLHFRVEDPAVRDALASSRPRIENALLAQGLSPSGFSVDLGGVQTQARFDSSDQAGDPKPRPRADRSAPPVEPADRSVLDQHLGGRPDGGRYIDYRL